MRPRRHVRARPITAKLALAAHNTMPGSGPRIDPNDYAATRQAKIERAAELRAQRRAEGDSLDALTSQDARPARKARKEVAPGWTAHTCKKTGKSYFHHAATAKTTWTKPPGCYDERENVQPGAEEPLREANGRSRRRDEDLRRSADRAAEPAPRDNEQRRSADRSAESQMSETEFENWLEVLKSRTLTGSQARRASSALARYGAAALDETPLLGRSDSLQSLKTSLRSKRGQTGDALRTKSAADVLGEPEPAEPVRAKTEQNRRPRNRPEWNDGFTEDTMDDAAQQREAEDETRRELAKQRRSAPKPASTDALPAGWTEHTDKRTGAKFYRDDVAGESTWTKPTKPTPSAAPRATSPPRGEPLAQSLGSYDDQGADARHRTMWKPTTEDLAEEGRWSPPATQKSPAQRRSPPKDKWESPPPATSGGVPDGAANARLDDGCVICARKMASTALDRMEKIHGQRCCPKCAPKKQRKAYNAAAARADGFDGDDRRAVVEAAKAVKKELVKKEKGFGGGNAKGGGKWKQQSNQLRDAMKAQREFAKAEKEGKPLPPVVASGPDMSLIGCPHCGRRFNEKAAERHIPKCQSIKARPKTLQRGSGKGLVRKR